MSSSLVLMLIFTKSLLVGFMVAIPPGPVGVLCIRATLSKAWGKSLVMGAGAATADALYATFAGLSVGKAALWIETSGLYLQPLGAFLVAWIGFSIMRTPVKPLSPQEKSEISFLGGWLSTFLVTLSNPLTFLAFAASFTSLGLTTAHHLKAVLVLASGVFLGAMLWWSGLTLLTHYFRYQLSPAHLRGINRISGILLLSLAAILCGRFVFAVLAS